MKVVRGGSMQRHHIIIRIVVIRTARAFDRDPRTIDNVRVGLFSDRWCLGVATP